MLFVVAEYAKDRKDVYNSADFDSKVVRFGLLADVADRCSFMIFNVFNSFRPL